MNNQQIRPGGFNILPPVVKNLIIINALFFLATFAIGHAFDIDLVNYLGLHYVKSPDFNPYQFVSYMFMHGGIWHLVFNMFALWMFGNTLENVWGPKRFLTFYMVTGIGAGVVQLLVTFISIQRAQSGVDPAVLQPVLNDILTTGAEILKENKNYVDPFWGKLNILYNTATVGASGAVFGILLAFGMMFPNTVLYIYFAFPIKAKYFVIIYGALELVMGISNRAGDNTAHFAHLGGMIFGFFMIKYWQKQMKSGRF